jgi:hypothetical protein
MNRHGAVPARRLLYFKSSGLGGLRLLYFKRDCAMLASAIVRQGNLAPEQIRVLESAQASQHLLY